MVFVFVEPDYRVYRIIRFAAHYRIGFFIKTFELLATNKVHNDGSGNLDIRKAMEYFSRYMPEGIRTEKPVMHISLNPHPDDRLTDTDLQDIAREYLEKLGFGDQPYVVFKHSDIARQHLHIVTIRVDENGNDCMKEMVQENYNRIKEEVKQIVKDELERIANDDNLKHLLQK